MKPWMVVAALLWAKAPSLAQDHATHAAAEDSPEPRTGSGTSWLPASTPMEAIHVLSGEWAFMVHGFANFVYQTESEPRGSDQFFSTNMAMFSADRGRFGVRFMASLEPTLGSTGYPLLLQTGETADGTNPLFDRQHPHDLLMEIALRYEWSVGSTDSLSVYFGPVGDPALGPSAFMHRFSAMDNPIAPLAHHWLDATHISYGVLTFGWSRANHVKLEGSLFNGREPDADRWNVEKFTLDSFSGRITVNPTNDWSIQGSLGLLNEPERLHPDQDVLRMTVSVTHNRALGRGNWHTTAAWGRNKWEELLGPPTSLSPGAHIHFTPGVQPTRNAVLAETSVRFKGAHTVFGRWEWAEKDELFRSADRRHQLVYDVRKLNVGYLVDFLRLSHARIGAGGYASVHWVPDDLLFVYGERPTSYGAYVRVKIH